MSNFIVKGISWMFISAGLCLLFLGGRELFTSYFDQEEVASSWNIPQEPEPAPPAPAPSRAVAPLPPPKLGSAVARLSIPRLEKDWYVVEGVGKKELRVGPGHMQGTALPGMSGNCIIAGHRDTHFRPLKDIKRGDEIEVETRAGKFVYRVTRTAIVSPRDKSPLLDTKEPVLNLITCYPFYWVGSAPKRFIVHAELERPQVATAHQVDNAKAVLP